MYVWLVASSMNPEKSPDASGSPATYTLFWSPNAVTSCLSTFMLIDQAAWNGSGVAAATLVRPTYT